MSNCRRAPSVEVKATVSRVSGFFGVLLAAGLILCPSARDRMVSAQTAPVPPPPSTSIQPSPMDQPLSLIAAAHKSYQRIQDYTCTFIKREQIGGQLQPDNIMTMKVRTRPFSVYLHWQAPKPLAGQQVCYVTGRNKGMMRVRSTGLLGVAGFVSVDPNDARAMQNNRHPITDAGIGNLIERYAKRWEMERRLNKTQVRVGTYAYNQRPCTRVETIHPDNSGGQYYAFRSVLYFDKETHLIVRVESYDWPKPGGNPGGDLLESYSYVDLRFNTGLGDDVFNH